jgi:hypothetical protein
MRKYFLFIIILSLSIVCDAQVDKASIKGYKPGMSFSDVGFSESLVGIVLGTPMKEMTFAGYNGTLTLSVSKFTNKITSVGWESKDKLYRSDAVKICEVFFSKYNIPKINITGGNQQSGYYYVSSTKKYCDINELYCSAAWNDSDGVLSFSIVNSVMIREDRALRIKQEGEEVKRKALDDM